MRKLILTIVLSAATSSAIAAIPTKDSIDALLDATHAQRVVDQMLVTIDGMMKQNMARASGGRESTPEQQRAAESMSLKVSQIFREEMSWDKLELLYVRIYQDTFTQEEIDGLIAFYRTPTGMSYVDKLPNVLRSTMAATQSMMGPMMQKLETAAKEVAEESKTAK